MNHKMLVLGAISWSVAGGYVLIHLLIGDLLTPAIMGIVLLIWLALRMDELTAVLAGEPEVAAPNQ